MARIQVIMAVFLFAFLATGTSAIIVEASDFLSSANDRNSGLSNYLGDGAALTLELIPASSTESQVPEKLRQQLTPPGARLVRSAPTDNQKDG